MDETKIEEELYYIKEIAEQKRECGEDIALFYASKMSLYIQELKDSRYNELSFFISILLQLDSLYRDEMNKRIIK